MTAVRLTPAEMMAAALIGISRNVSALKRGLRSKVFDGDPSAWSAHIEGACGEAAFAKSANVFWGSTVNTFKSGGDVGQVQVRTRSKHHYELIVRDDDKDDSLFVLVTGQAPEFQIRGWIKASDAKRTQWSKTHGGHKAAYFVPHEALHSMDTLPVEVLA